MDGHACFHVRNERAVAFGMLVGLLALIVLPAPVSGRCVDKPHRTSFLAQSAVGWDLTPNGLLAVYYSEGNGIPDHMSLHRIVHHGFDVSSRDELRRSFGPQVTVFGSGEPEDGPSYYYIFLTNPLFYGTGLDDLGLATRMWSDREEDGINGNEEWDRFKAY